MSTSSVSSSTSSNYTSATQSTSSRARLSGTSLISGLDTDSLVKAMTATTRSKIAKQQQKKQSAQWKQDSYREVTTKVKAFSDKYFSYSNSTGNSNILSSKFFDAATIKNPSTLLNVTGSTSAAKNMQVGSITQLAQAAGFTSTKKVSNQAIQSGTILQKWEQSNVSGQSMAINYGGKDYSITLPENVVVADGADSSTKMTAINDALNAQIQSNTDLKGKLKFTTDGSTLTLTQDTGTSGDLKVTGGDLATSLGFAKTTTGAASATGAAVDLTTTGKLFKATDLQTALSGSTLTFSLNGISKDIIFNADAAKTNFSTPALVSSYLQDQLNSSYGAGKVTVSVANGGLNFKTTDTTSVLSINSSDNTNILGETGALKMGAGESNRIELSKTLAHLSSEMKTTGGVALTAGADSKYSITINGQPHSFAATDTLNTVLSTFNNDDKAAVTIAYSSVTDTFNVTAKSSGAQGEVAISDATDGGNLAASLFGTAGTAAQVTAGTANYSIASGQDAKLKVSFDNGSSFTDITRTENNFSMDGVNFELLGTTDSTKSLADTTIKFTSESNVDDLYKKISSFVDDYNAIITLVNGKTSETKDSDYPALSEEQKTSMTDTQITDWNAKAKVGVLQNDGILSKLSTDLRYSMTNLVSSSNLKSLSKIGIATAQYDYTSNGKLVIDETTLKTALTQNADAVSAMFTNSTDGISARIKSVIDQNVGTFGGDGALIRVAGTANTLADQSTLSTNISDYATTIKDLQTKLSTEQDKYWAKFTAMETQLSKLNAQSAALTSSSSSNN